jgi:hypothetical protein
MRVRQVAQLSGFVSADTAYHHGEASLQSTIIGLAHNFVGSNNINLLVPQGTRPPSTFSWPSPLHSLQCLLSAAFGI